MGRRAWEFEKEQFEDDEELSRLEDDEELGVWDRCRREEELPDRGGRACR